jgi:hypothetical protein
MSEQRQGLPLIEAFPVEDQYVDGLGRMEVTGQNVRFVFYTGRPKAGGEYDREVATRLVMPMEAITPLLTQIEQLRKAVAGMSVLGLGTMN